MPTQFFKKLLLPSNPPQDTKLELQEKKLKETQELIKAHRKSQRHSNKLPIDNILTTERYHPKTGRLSQLAQNELETAIQTLKDVDEEALKILLQYEPTILELQQAIISTLTSGKKVFVSGCGSAGRAALLAVKLCFDAYPEYKDRIIVIIATGDASAVKPAENSEDNGEYGINQLMTMGWQPDDLLIALSASGSAEFIQAQLAFVAGQDRRKPFFLYCNSDEEVAVTFAQRKIFADEALHKKIHFRTINVKSMGLTGSTRMQAGTAQTLATAVPLLDSLEFIINKRHVNSWPLVINALLDQLIQTDLSKLVAFIQYEADIYQHKKRVDYCVSPNIGLNVLVDTTERSPTFNLAFFENDLDPDIIAAIKVLASLSDTEVLELLTTIEELANIEKPEKLTPEQKAILKAINATSLCRVIILGTHTAEAAWRAILGRDPIALNWKNIPHTTLARILGYDLSENMFIKRTAYLPTVKYERFNISLKDNEVSMQLENASLNIEFSQFKTLSKPIQTLAQQTFIKLMLNTHSTLVMGRFCPPNRSLSTTKTDKPSWHSLGLYYGNLMIFVRPSNTKLISRGIRLSYELIEQIGTIEHAIVPSVLEYFIKNRRLQGLLVDIISETFYKNMLSLEAGESIVLETEEAVVESFLKPISYRYLLDMFLESSIFIANKILTKRNMGIQTNLAQEEEEEEAGLVIRLSP